MKIDVCTDNTAIALSSRSACDTRPFFTGKEGNVLFNDALNTFYLRLYYVGHIVKDNLDSERGKPLLPHGLLFPNRSGQVRVFTVHIQSKLL